MAGASVPPGCVHRRCQAHGDWWSPATAAVLWLLNCSLAGSDEEGCPISCNWPLQCTHTPWGPAARPFHPVAGASLSLKPIAQAIPPAAHLHTCGLQPVHPCHATCLTLPCSGTSNNLIAPLLSPQPVKVASLKEAAVTAHLASGKPRPAHCT